MRKVNRNTIITKRRAGILVCLLLALFLVSATAFADVFAEDKAADDDGTAKDSTAEIEAVDPIDEADNYTTVVYDNSNGLPTAVANDIAHTKEGFIWIGSYGGLIRYDGNDFERIDAKKGITSAGCLFLDSQDRLWIGTNENGIGMMEQDQFHWFSEEKGLAAAKVRDVTEGADGLIYAGTISGISIIYPDFHIENLDHPKIAGVYVEQLESGVDGTVYGLSSENDFFSIKKNKLISYLDHSKANIKGITSIFPDPEDPTMIYFGTEGSEIYHCKAKGNPTPSETIDISPLSSVSYIKKIDDNYWICANNGIGVIDEKGFHYLDNVPFKHAITNVMEDYEGNLWFSSSRQGVMKIVSNRFTNLFEKYDIPAEVVNSTCMVDDNLYVGMEDGMVVIGKDGPVSEVPVTEARYASGEEIQTDNLIQYLDGVRIRSISRDTKDRLWIATWQAMGLLRYDHGKLTVFSEKEGIPSDRIRVMDETPDGAIQVVCTGGVCVIKGDKVTDFYGEKEGIKTKELLTLANAPNGDILAGSNGGGIYIMGEKGVRCIDRKDGLTSGVIMHIYYDAKRKVFWIITGNSIAYMTTDYKVTTVEQFPYSDNLDLFENDRGEMWVASSDGLYVVSADEMLANEKINYTHYGIANGMSGTAVSNSHSELTKDGDLYLSGSTGVMHVNINEPVKDFSNIKQDVPFIVADGKYYYPDENREFTIPSDVRKLTIYGYVFNYSLTDPTVSMQLEGFDQHPMEYKSSEMHPMIYTNLKGGSYTYVMKLKDELGNDSKTISVVINKKRGITEYLWFNIFLLMLLGGLVFLLSRWYVQRNLKKMERQHREEVEKERVTNELLMANRIQMSVLPHEYPPFPDRDDFNIYASSDPARAVGGDFYDYFLIDDDHLGLVIADVSGKGVPASLYMMNTKVVMKSFAKMGLSVEETLNKTNETICDNNPMEMFITAWMGILELSTGKLTAANAGHEYPVLKRADGLFELYKQKHGFVLGGMDGVKYKEYELQLNPGDKFFVYTDGLPEATNADLKMFTIERALDALNADAQAAPEQLIHNVHEAVNDFVKDAEQFDDLTMLCLEYKGHQS